MPRPTYKHIMPIPDLDPTTVPFDVRAADLLRRIFSRPYTAAKVYIYARCYGASKRTAIKRSLSHLFFGFKS